MLTRRILLLSAGVILTAKGLVPSPAWAQNLDQAAAFITALSGDIAAVVNGPGTAADKQKKLQAIVDRTVDVDGVARFCLGRFWRAATPEQQKEYQELFHRVLMMNITGKIGEYQGVSIAVGRAEPREGAIMVASVVNRPGNPPSKVDWIVSTDSGSPKIIDLIAEGTSLRLTQRSDYSAYLARNNNSVQVLIDALKQQASQQG
jgi:phospholipid transport system substrate-binding protein